MLAGRILRTIYVTSCFCSSSVSDYVFSTEGGRWSREAVTNTGEGDLTISGMLSAALQEMPDNILYWGNETSDAFLIYDVFRE